jgi:hypothetical protein
VLVFANQHHIGFHAVVQLFFGVAFNFTIYLWEKVDGKMLLNPFKRWYKINSGKVDRNTQNLLYDGRV